MNRNIEKENMLIAEYSYEEDISSKAAGNEAAGNTAGNTTRSTTGSTTGIDFVREDISGGTKES